MRRARGARARGFDKLPSLSDVEILAFDEKSTFEFLLDFRLQSEPRFISGNQAKNQKWIFHRKLKVPSSVISSQPKTKYMHARSHHARRRRITNINA
jgi:hypothetical protein